MESNSNYFHSYVGVVGGSYTLQIKLTNEQTQTDQYTDTIPLTIAVLLINQELNWHQFNS